jgi:hypothetical protein
MVQRPADGPRGVRQGGTPMERRGPQAGDRSMAPSTTRRGGEMATTGAEAPRHGGHPVRRLRVARWNASDRRRWGEMPKAAGGPRPLGRSGVEDTIVQARVRRLLAAI